MSDPSLALYSIAVEDSLRQLVPGLYLLMALYVGVAGPHRKWDNWAFIAVFGVTGVSTYMALNEPGFFGDPVYLHLHHWYILMLLGMALIAILLFNYAVDRLDLVWPWVYLRRACDRSMDLLASFL